MDRKGISFKEQVRIACNLAGISMTELGKQMGEKIDGKPISQQSMSKRLATGKFTKEEMYIMAEVLGCKLQFYFEFPNGIQVR